MLRGMHNLFQFLYLNMLYKLKHLCMFYRIKFHKVNKLLHLESIQLDYIMYIQYLKYNLNIHLNIIHKYLYLTSILIHI
jgi:hypothetical protein